MAVRAFSKGDILSMRTSPSKFYAMMARSRLDDVTVLFDRIGPPACDATS
jgi:hypothetical protein